VTVKLRTTAAAVLLGVGLLLLTGCAAGDGSTQSEGTEKPWSVTDLLGAADDATPTPAPGSSENPYSAPNDPYGRGYVAEWVITSDGHRMLCIRYGGSSNGSDSISCDFAPGAHPPAAAQ
jgi:hypothetical protein